VKALGLLRFLQALCLNGRTSKRLSIETSCVPVVRSIALLGHIVSFITKSICETTSQSSSPPHRRHECHTQSTTRKETTRQRWQHPQMETELSSSEVALFLRRLNGQRGSPYGASRLKNRFPYQINPSAIYFLSRWISQPLKWIAQRFCIRQISPSEFSCALARQILSRMEQSKESIPWWEEGEGLQQGPRATLSIYHKGREYYRIWRWS